MWPWVTAFVALGANLGNAEATLGRATHAINALPGVRVVRVSSLYRSAPVDAIGPDFINGVVEVATQLSAPDLLLQLQMLEQTAGRERTVRNAPRPLDLDILIFADKRIDTPTLTVPHPRMRERAFVLLPLAEIAPGRVSPAELAAVSTQHIERMPAR